MSPLEISAAELKQALVINPNLVLLDVRTLAERQENNIGGLHIPLQELAFRHQELDRHTDIVIYCRAGARSMTALNLLSALGFNSLKSLAGGLMNFT